MFLCVALNAFFVAAEMGLARIRRTRVDQLVEEGDATAKLVQSELDEFDRFVSACQLGITLTTLALGALGEEAFAGNAVKEIESLGLFSPALAPIVHWFCYIVAFSVIAFAQTILGELAPKIYTMERAEQVLFHLIVPMRIWIKLTSPLLAILTWCVDIGFKLLKIETPARRHYVHSGEELRMLVSASHEEGVLEESEEEMLHSIFDFAETVASDIMTPRTDMVCLPATATINEFVKLALTHGHSRLPVYEEDLDRIFGMVHIRDGLRAVVEQKGGTQVRELVRKVLIVPENKDAGNLLTEFKKTKTHMAIVVDEYGSTRGMVTMEDLIEELVGDIADEHEIVEEYIQQLPDGNYSLDARIALDDVDEKIGLHIEDEEFNTLGGHVFGQLGREPKVGDQIETETYALQVEEADRHRIVRLKLIVKQPAQDDGAANGDGKTAVPPSEEQNGAVSKPIGTTK